jgi:hypothetical protein
VVALLEVVDVLSAEEKKISIPLSLFSSIVLDYFILEEYVEEE